MHTNICIIGHGFAGAICAIVCADAGLKVTVLTAGENMQSSSTYHAQGGIVYEKLQTPKHKELLIEDIFRAGDGLCYQPAVEKLVERGSDYIDVFLRDRLQVAFDQNDQGELDLIREAAHSKDRIIHVEDQTGRSIQEQLNVVLTQHPNIQLMSGYTAIDLLASDHHAASTRERFGINEVLGCYALDQKSREVHTIYSDVMVLATGGLGQIYKHTTNPIHARGDGVAMAYRAGARVERMEYVQFHPSVFFYKGKPRFLVSEALRGFGAILRNGAGEAFMTRYHELKEMAPRDVVSRAVYQEMTMSDSARVFLDLSHLPAEQVFERFPFISQACQSYGFDLSKDWIPVVPAAHYHCGGVWVDLEGRTSLPRLFAVGEVSCTGVHGANRLASTSLLECLVWGVDAAKAIVNESNLVPPRNIRVNPWISPSSPVDPALVRQDWDTLKQTMLNYVGVVRTQERLERASEMLPHFREQVERFYRASQLTDDLIGLRNATLCASLLFQHVRRNPISRGCHYYED